MSLSIPVRRFTTWHYEFSLDWSVPDVRDVTADLRGAEAAQAFRAERGSDSNAITLNHRVGMVVCDRA
jgi:hypothetical protein